MHKIPVIRFYFPLDALHVSDYISPSSGAIFISCTSYLVHVDMAIAIQQPHVPAYTKRDVQLIKVAPDDGLT
jgi:hypothetical protein